MKRISKTVFIRLIVLILLIALFGAFDEGTFEEIAEAQQNYPAPVIAGVSPAEAEPGESVEPSVTGKYFLQGAKLSFFPQIGISVNWVKVLNPENISAGIAIAQDTAIGARDVVVINPDGQNHTAKGAFYVKAVVLPPPVIISIVPNEAEPGESIELSILGVFS